MILAIYKNGLCDPQNKHGTLWDCGDDTKLVDNHISAFVASIDPKFLSNYRIFILNKLEDLATTDIFVVMDELPANSREHFKEVNIYEIAKEVNKKFKELDKLHQDKMKKAQKNVDKALAERVHLRLENTERQETEEKPTLII